LEAAGAEGFGPVIPASVPDLDAICFQALECGWAVNGRLVYPALAELIEQHGDISTDELRRRLQCRCGAGATTTVSWAG
jgi:hypothetical protein